MKRKLILITSLFSGLLLVGIGHSKKPTLVKTLNVAQGPDHEAPIAPPKAEDIDRALTKLKSAKAPSLELVAKELEESGSEELVESFKDYQAEQKSYDRLFEKYEAAHDRYKQLVHAAVDGNGSEVEAALREVDDSAKILQEETAQLNSKAATFLEDYRRYTFEKFGLALN